MGRHDLREDVVRIPDAGASGADVPASERASPRMWILIALLAFAVAIVLMEHGALDARVRSAVLELRRAMPGELRSVLELGSKLLEKASGAPVTFSLATVVGTFAAVGRRDPRPGVILVVTVVALVVVGDALKDLFDRPAPDERAAGLTSGRAFPSGHTAQAIAVWGILASVAVRELRRPWSWIGAVAAGSLAVGAAASRLLLDSHWASDVLAGLGLGGVALVLGSTALRPARGDEPPPRRADVVDLRTL